MEGAPMTVKTQEVYAEEWNKLPWKNFQANLYRLQHRIYKAAKNNDKDLIKRLQRLLMGSKCSKYLAVRQLTQFNIGKKATRIDGTTFLDPKSRIELAESLEISEKWKPEKLRKVGIPKSNGKKKPLGIPTMRDRAVQCLLKYAIEPVYEAITSPGSYGFRPGYSTWDIQKHIFQNLRSRANGNLKRILELTIEKCFDNINYDKLLSLITLPPCGLKALKSALQAGILLEMTNRKMGTDQRGLISPLLMNIALDGVEDLSNQIADGHKYQQGYRYADDMIYFLKEEECSKTLLNKIQNFLETRGLSLQKEKTRLVPATEGFNFLGWHFKVKSQNNKVICCPSRENRKDMIIKLKATLKDARFSLEDRVLKAKTIYRRWVNYHQYCNRNQINSWAINRWTHWYLIKSSKWGSKKVTEITKDIFTGHKFKSNGFISNLKGKSTYDND